VLILASTCSVNAGEKHHFKRNNIVYDSGTSQQKYYHLIKQFTMGYNDVYETPYYALIGKKDTPKMLVHGGMHGDEIAGYMVCDSIIRKINILEGTLIIIPRLNIQACKQDTRQINIDLNHAFPGDITSDIYEFRLAHEFMWIVDSVKPDIIINLHEALTKYNPMAANDSEKAFGQVLITCVKPYESILENAYNNMNAKIPRDDFKFHVHFYAFREYSSLDNFVAKFDIKSYTVETYRGFNIADRVKLQEIAVIQFMQEAGLKFEYPDIKF
jgi:predicted deacylase